MHFLTFIPVFGTLILRKIHDDSERGFLLQAVQNPLKTEKVSKLLRTFAIPSIIAMLVSALYNIVDQIFIGRKVGYLGNSATNVIYPIVVISLAFSLLIGDGAASYLSIKLGEGDKEKASIGVGNAIITSIITGIIFLIVFINPYFLK